MTSSLHCNHSESVLWIFYCLSNFPSLVSYWRRLRFRIRYHCGRAWFNIVWWLHSVLFGMQRAIMTHFVCFYFWFCLRSTCLTLHNASQLHFFFCLNSLFYSFSNTKLFCSCILLVVHYVNKEFSIKRRTVIFIQNIISKSMCVWDSLFAIYCYGGLLFYYIELT